MNIKRPAAPDAVTANPFLKVGVYGPSGAGKTTLGATAYERDPAGVVVGHSEGQAEAIVRLWNPKATTVHLDTYASVQAFWEWCRKCLMTKTLWEGAGKDADGRNIWKDTKEPYVIETVVLDSFSDVFRLIKAEVIDSTWRKARAKFTQGKGSSEGFEDAPVANIQDWGVIQDKGIALLRAFRDLPCNLVCLYALGESEEGGVQVYRPYLQGKELKSTVMSFYNAFGFLSRRLSTDEEQKAGKGPVVREVAFLADDRWTTKPLDGLDPVEVPSFRVWAQKFRKFGADLGKRRDVAAKKAEAGKAKATETVTETAEAVKAEETK